MIRHLLLDLDNTLYPASGGMDEGITRRMLEFVALHIGVTFEEGVKLRGKGIPSYGTTLEWLKAEHGLTDQNAFFEAVHPESEIAELQEDLKLRPFLLSLGLPTTLLTNAPMTHARRVLRFFKIEDVFTGIYDITFNNGRGKPYPASFLNTLEATGFTVQETLFVDDHPKYVRGYKAIGGQAAIVDESGAYQEMAEKEGFFHIRSIYGLSDILKSDRITVNY